MAFPGNWTLYYDWGCDGSYSSTPMTVAAPGTWTNGEGGTGHWIQAAGMITFQFNGLKTTYSGNLASKSVTGIMSTFGGSNGCFYMLQAGAPHIAAVVEHARAKGKPDAGGK
jgi:hypothetical protein